MYNLSNIIEEIKFCCTFKPQWFCIFFYSSFCTVVQSNRSNMKMNDKYQ